MDAAGGPAQTICDVGFPSGGGTWNREGVILFSGAAGSGFFRVSAAGGEPKAVLQLDKSRQENAQEAPQFLPDGRHFVYSSQAGRNGRNYAGFPDSQGNWPGSSAGSRGRHTQPRRLVYRN